LGRPDHAWTQFNLRPRSFAANIERPDPIFRPVEAAANRIKKARVYVDRVKALTTKIDRAFAELPSLDAEQRKLLDGIRKRDAAKVQELLALK
jgi:hypothetical protein